jgi:two-component system sensor histidine kinase RegB
MWIALTAIAELVAHYVAASAAAFEAQERAVEDARERAARSERRAALMAMAAGAAHELSTPLATIAVAARELDLTAGRLVLAAAHHSVDGGSGQSADVAALRDDARLIRSEVDRCQVVLDAMTGRATSGVLADDTPLTIESLVARARERLPEADRRRLKVDLVVAGIVLPNGAEAVQAIAVLLKNAFDASAPHDDVTLRIVRNQDALRIEVADCGPGMSPDVLKRVGEPFYTTKEAGRGVGLGLFLARGFAERMRGSLEFVIRDGTTAIMEIPLDRAGAGV